MRIPREWQGVWGELERAELTRQATAELTRLAELDIGICMYVLTNVCEMWRTEERHSISKSSQLYTNQCSIGS